MQVSVIIPALNEEAGIVAAIARAWQAGAAEVIVVDGGSRDQTVSLCQQANCHLVQARPGRAVQQNAGAAGDKQDILLFMHADNYLAADGIQQITAAVGNGHACGAFRQQIDASGFFFRWLEWGNARRVKWWGLAYGDQAIFLTRQLFDEVGGFPEVKLMEDLLLMREVRRRLRPTLLPGPLHVSPRRWQRYGPLRQTLRNWALLLAWQCGAKPDRLAAYYRRHDK